jgi:Na+-transporting NADH:ubiquinone oxidoreductase subunit D
MSTAVAEVVEKKSEPLFSKKNKKLITNPLDIDNPITVQVLGVCSALAVTTQMKPAPGYVHCFNGGYSQFEWNYLFVT